MEKFITAHVKISLHQYLKIYLNKKLINLMKLIHSIALRWQAAVMEQDLPSLLFIYSAGCSERAGVLTSVDSV